jgi:Flp pilus assembly pilin Flp
VPYQNRPLGGSKATGADLRWTVVKKLEAGQAHTEYGLILFLIGITVIGALILLGQSVHDLWHAITTAMPR